MRLHLNVIVFDPPDLVGRSFANVITFRVNLTYVGSPLGSNVSSIHP